MDPCLLAFDTSTEQMSVGLAVATATWRRQEAGGAQASARLIPLAQSLLAQAGIDWAQLDAIAFGAGPGAFTGLRAACAVAQGLGFGAQRPLIPLDSLLVVAEDARERYPAAADELHWVAVDARMDEVYAAAYRWSAPQWQVVHPPRLYTLDALARHWRDAPPTRVAGNAVTVFAPQLPFGAAFCVAEVGDRAAALLRLAASAWREGRCVDPAAALPVYLRDKVALTTAERAARAEPPR